MSRPVQSKEEVAQRLRAAGRQLAALGVTGVGLFGSFLTGRQTTASGVDYTIVRDVATSKLGALRGQRQGLLGRGRRSP